MSDAPKLSHNPLAMGAHRAVCFKEV